MKKRKVPHFYNSSSYTVAEIVGFTWNLVLFTSGLLGKSYTIVIQVVRRRHPERNSDREVHGDDTRNGHIGSSSSSSARCTRLCGQRRSYDRVVGGDGKGRGARGVKSRVPLSMRRAGPPKAAGKRADYRCKGITIAQTCPNSGNREIRRAECRCLAAGPVIVLSLLTTDTARGRGEAVDVVGRRGGRTLS